MEEGLADPNGNTITKMRGSKNLSFCREWCVPAQKTVTNPKPEQNKTTGNLELMSGLFL